QQRARSAHVRSPRERVVRRTCHGRRAQTTVEGLLDGTPRQNQPGLRRSARRQAETTCAERPDQRIWSGRILALRWKWTRKRATRTAVASKGAMNALSRSPASDRSALARD